MSNRPIAVFDSGLGGLSVVRHLRQSLPNESIVYFGDTARVPYGMKTRRTVEKFSLELCNFLLQFNPKLIVAACNTSSALAVDELKRTLPVPVVGVVEPGAAAAVARREGCVAVLGTEATIASGAYPAAIHALAPDLEVIPLACPLFVPLVEEGRACDDPIVKLVAREYLEPLLSRDLRAVVLGCTHYPLLRAALAEILGPQVEIVDSGRETTHAVARFLVEHDCLCGPGSTATIRYFVSDNPARFRRVGSRFLAEEIGDVELVAPEHYITGSLVENDAG